MEPADDLAGLWIADEHGERAKVVVSGLAQIIGAQTIANHLCVSGIQLIGDGNVWVALGSLFGKFASHPTGPVSGLDRAAYVFFVDG